MGCLVPYDLTGPVIQHKNLGSVMPSPDSPSQGTLLPTSLLWKRSQGPSPAASTKPTDYVPL